jgi:hypothetical protein
MKINPTNAAIATLLSALLAYAMWSIEGSNRHYVAIGGFVFFAGTLVPIIGGEFEKARNGLNLRTVCGLFFVLGLITNAIFAMVDFSATAYIVVSASLFLIYVLLANSIYGARQ